MGYCPFEHWLGAWLGAWHDTGAQGTQAGAGRHGRRRAGCWGVQVRQQALGAGGRASRRAGRAARAHGTGAGCATGQQAVHLVHSACFWPCLTRFFSGVRFLDIVREPGS